jgi:hypothetical protein
MKKILSIMLLICSALFLQSCDHAQSNVQTLYSKDFGQHWELIPVGNTIPKAVMPGEFKTTIPGAPMTGESHFKTTFNNVKAAIDLDYEYEIFDAVAFISNAKYLAKTNIDGDEVSGNNSRFESAENTIIDKRIKDISRDLLSNTDIVDFDQSEFEDILLEKINKVLAERGVRINYLSFVPTPSEQTAQAIDVATAMRIYESKNLKEVGMEVIKNRAGANRIVVTSSPANNQKEDENP